MSDKLSTLLVSSPLTGAALAAADGFYVYDASASGSSKSKGILLSELIKALLGYGESANASGDTTVTPHALALQHTEVITVTGAGSTTRKLILAISAPPTRGARLVLRLLLPQTAEITLEFRNATSGGTTITSLLTDGSGDDATVEFYFDGTAWQFLRFHLPANA